MPAETKANMSAAELQAALRDKLGMNEKKSEETLKNARLSARLESALCSIAAESLELTQDRSNLIIYWCGKVKEQIWQDSLIILKYIVEDKIDTRAKVDYSLQYLLDSKTGKFSTEDFESAIGVGVNVEDDDIVKTIKDSLSESKGPFITSKIINEVFNKLRFADRLKIKTILEANIDEYKKLSASSTPENVQDQATIKTSRVSNSSYSDMFSDKTKFHEVGKNYTTDGYVITDTTFKNLEAHLQRTGGKVVTRFPPEPNGLLHIGHAKAITLDFCYAKHFDGITYLRFDDTNPEKEEERFMTEIKDIISWLGYTPYKVTYASDYFDTIYQHAITMIKKGLAYVCHQSREEMKQFQDQAKYSPFRDRSVSENLSIFEEMHQGLIDEGKAVLRLKYQMPDGKMDPVAYRIKFMEHARTGDKWCIYPSYDFTHPICDSIEDVTHSMCTKEFQTHRPMYYWLCNSLDIYCPVQWEFSRLNLTHSLLSKRKILKLIEEGICDDWDDPRLFTLSALKRRGVTKEALYKFCEANSVTVAQSYISPANLDHFIREDLNRTSPRAVGILRPLEVEIANYNDFIANNPEIPTDYFYSDFPNDSNKTANKLTLKSTFFIDKSDFRIDESSPDFRRLTSQQPVGLLHTNLQIKFLEYQVLNSPKKSRLVVKLDKISSGEKPKAAIHWLSQPLIAEIRIFHNLFKHEFPEREEYGGFMNDVNPSSIEVFEHAFVERRLAKATVGDRFQFVREGYFCVDKDSTDLKLVMNLTVSLREDPKK